MNYEKNGFTYKFGSGSHLALIACFTSFKKCPFKDHFTYTENCSPNSTWCEDHKDSPSTEGFKAYNAHDCNLNLNLHQYPCMHNL